MGKEFQIIQTVDEYSLKTLELKFTSYFSCQKKSVSLKKKSLLFGLLLPKTTDFKMF